MSLRTPLSRVRGLGSAHEGTDHFWKQRVTALANLVLVIGLLWFVLASLGSTHAEFAARVANPFVAGMLILLIVSGVMHMKIGMQVIIEDYVHGEGAKIAALIGNIFFAAAVGIVGVLAVLKLALGG
ncbi:succinate dehydrogenase, hydrophobic membrane anchor protein [Tepidamorphus sp. 3E244]|uniref:succinate dehydrogenase, hydrophobic membrane anchor protein n=1 Tax=Tepidamorphus sp. 3E244 TaxID=3385498 RepID=UPI0038FD1D71